MFASVTASGANRRNSLVRFPNEASYAVDRRLAVAAAPSASMKLFTGIGAGYSGSTFTPNTANWLQDLRSQLTGFHMGAGGYNQSYALMPLGDRFVLNCAHNGPEPLPLSLKYVKGDGTVFTTTATHWINDRVGAVSSDAQQAYVDDRMIYVLADALPAWVYRAPILQLTSEQKTAFANVPTIMITQGNWTSGPSSPYGFADTPDNRMVAIRNFGLSTPLSGAREAFRHVGQTGDSGCPDYLLIGDVLYLVRLTTFSNGSGPFIGDQMAYLNSLIARGATAAGISPITLTAVTLDSLL